MCCPVQVLGVDGEGGLWGISYFMYGWMAGEGIDGGEVI